MERIQISISFDNLSNNERVILSINHSIHSLKYLKSLKLKFEKINLNEDQLISFNYLFNNNKNNLQDLILLFDNFNHIPYKSKVIFYKSISHL